MSQKDIIKCIDRTIFFQFTNTGLLHASSKFDLTKDITFKRNNKAVQAHYHHSAQVVIIDEFPNEALAQAAFTRLQSAILWHTRYRCCASIIKNIVKWVMLPAILFILVLAINMMLTKAIGANMAIASPGQVALPNYAVQQIVPHEMANNKNSDLAKAIADGVRSGKYSVQLSSGKKGTLYVFSDPACRHCQNLETELNKLTKDYTIHIFPVSVFGGDSSKNSSAGVLCSNADIRKAEWEEAIYRNNGIAKSLSLFCSQGYRAVEANDKIFSVMNFSGTPTIINSLGEQFPDSLPNTEKALRQWMESLGRQ